MRKLCVFLLFFIFISNGKSEVLERIPFGMDFQGIIARNDTIIAYGSNDIMFMRAEEGAPWETRTVFRKGSIVAMFWENNRLTAFTDLGDAAVSEDNGRTWSIKHITDDTLIAVTGLPGGYCARTKYKLFTMDNEFNFQHEYALISKYNFSTWPFYPTVPWLYRYSLACFRDQIIAETDYAKYIVFDLELNPVDTVSFSKLKLCTTCNNKLQMRTYGDYLYIVVDNRLFRTKDMADFDTVLQYGGDFLLYRPGSEGLALFEYENDTLPYIYRAYTIDHNNSITKEMGSTAKEFQYELSIQDIINYNGRIYVLGDGKYMLEINMEDSAMTLKSYLSGSILDKMDDSTIYFINDKYILISTDNGKTIRPNIPWKENLHYCKNVTKINFQAYDKKEKTLYIGTTDYKEKFKGVYSTGDFGKTIRFDSLPAFNFISCDPRVYYSKLPHFPYNMQIRDDAFVVSWFVQRNDTVVYSRILTYDKQFHLVCTYRDSGYVIDYVNSGDTNSYLVHCLNIKDNTFEAKYTTDHGRNWEIIKKYRPSDLLFRYTELTIDGSPILFLFNFCTDDSVYSIEALDVKKRTISTVYQYKVPDYDKNTWSLNQACAENDSIYLAVRDTIFYMTDINDRSKWKYYILPNGNFAYQQFEKTGNRFWGLFFDSEQNNISRYWLEIRPDSTVSVVESETTADGTYLYLYLPKPTPSTNHVRTLIYFDPAVEFDLNRVGVIDAAGEKVEGSGKITFERLSRASGYLNWDCSQVSSGVYFIHIRHGNTARVVKVIVSR